MKSHNILYYMSSYKSSNTALNLYMYSDKLIQPLPLLLYVVQLNSPNILYYMYIDRVTFTIKCT